MRNPKKGKDMKLLEKKLIALKNILTIKWKSNVMERLMRKVDWWEEGGCVEGRW